MQKQIKIGMFILLIFVCWRPIVCFAGWSDPQEIVAGAWGSGTGQFYFARSDTFDYFPKEFSVDDSAAIIIADEGNKRVVIYNPDGSLKITITKPTELPVLDDIKKWPSRFLVNPIAKSFAIDCDYQKTGMGRQPNKICVIDYTGTIITKVDMGEVFIVESGYVIFRNNTYSLYTPTGQLLKTYTERPLELGAITSTRKQPDGNYQTIIEYNDAVFNVKQPEMVEWYRRDQSAKLNVILRVGEGEQEHYQVLKYNRCSKVIGTVDLPIDTYNQDIIMPADGSEPDYSKYAEYGKPVIAPNGDVYTWKRTPDKYSIVKWTWQDDPNQTIGLDAPTGLAVMPSTTGLYLTAKEKGQVYFLDMRKRQAHYPSE